MRITRREKNGISVILNGDDILDLMKHDHTDMKENIIVIYESEEERKANEISQAEI